MEEKFKATVEHIFNNWTGLQLAVEHSMGGPNSRQVAIDIVNYMTEFCINSPNVEVIDIQEALEDVMDEEFSTICEDNSPAEIANLLYRFLTLLKSQNHAQYEIEYLSLPTSKVWLSQPQPQVCNTTTPQTNIVVKEPTSDVSMEEDCEWTEVKSRKKK